MIALGEAECCALGGARTSSTILAPAGESPKLKRDPLDGRRQGLLHFENNIIFRLFPLHIGMRWYWKDFESMERWTRSEPHRTWWQNFIRDSGGTGFWHEAYFMRGGMEGVYVDVNRPPLGFQAFARDVPMRGPMFSARQRLQVSGDTPAQPPGMAESDLYQSGASGREGAA